MSRLAREHPEDDSYQSLEGQREVLSDIADRVRKREREEGLDFWEGRQREIQDRVEEEFRKHGPSPEEKFNEGRGYYG